MLFSQANLPYWIFLGMGVLLFLFIIISGRGDQDIDLDTDTDVEFDADSGSEFSFGQLLGWAGIGKAPLILLLAIDLSFWGIFGLILNVWLGSKASGFIGSIVLFSSLMLSLLMGRLIAQPIGNIFAEFSEDASSDRLIGCIGTVNSAYIPIENQGKIGQVDVLDAKRNFLTISAVLAEWATIVPQRGEKVLIIELKPRNYIVIAKDSADEESWLTSSHYKK
ncbi:DUF1449 family protein [Fortiea sp. LEGE XX443]|uniref:OB-fold-containig protein n=1 Tax=Fortiea sp. LEGE XX443 TaxID=1828611 RepID=UPI00187E75DD|nr:OB-fold-containig protein [Fortiea sp. LEGE XX443]MBE9005061.1 DUF1449 family protein [Fortiea sp. LEGE XX443]